MPFFITGTYLAAVGFSILLLMKHGTAAEQRDARDTKAWHPPELIQVELGFYYYHFSKQ